jgi:uridine kinase
MQVDPGEDPSADLVAHLTGLVLAAPPRAGSTRLVAVDGPSGAGKTTLADALATRLGAPVVHMDDLYPGWDGLRESRLRVADWVTGPLRDGRPPRYRRWDWARSEYGEWVQVEPSEVVVLEGCGSGALDTADALSLLVWVEAEEPVRRQRGLRRDPGYADFWERWGRQEREVFAQDRTRERADVVVDTTPDAAGGHTLRMAGQPQDGQAQDGKAHDGQRVNGLPG